MNARLLTICLLLVAAMPFSAAASAESAGKVVRLATLTDYAPMCFAAPGMETTVVETVPPGQDSGVLRGYAWDVVRETFHARGYTVELYMVPWARVMHYLRKGVVDAGFPAIRTPVREREFDFSSRAVMREPISLYTLSGLGIDWHGLEYLDYYRIGVVREWSNGPLDQHNYVPVVCDDLAEAVQRLERGQADLVACHGWGCAGKSDQTRGDEAALKRIAVIAEEPQYLMAAEGGADWALSEFDLGYAEIEKRGLLKGLEDKWGVRMN